MLHHDDCSLIVTPSASLPLPLHPPGSHSLVTKQQQHRGGTYNWYITFVQLLEAQARCKLRPCFLPCSGKDRSESWKIQDGVIKALSPDTISYPRHLFGWPVAISQEATAQTFRATLGHFLPIAVVGVSDCMHHADASIVQSPTHDQFVLVQYTMQNTVRAQQSPPTARVSNLHMLQIKCTSCIHFSSTHPDELGEPYSIHLQNGHTQRLEETALSQPLPMKCEQEQNCHQHRLAYGPRGQTQF